MDLIYDAFEEKFSGTPMATPILVPGALEKLGQLI